MIDPELAAECAAAYRGRLAALEIAIPAFLRLEVHYSRLLALLESEDLDDEDLATAERVEQLLAMAREDQDKAMRAYEPLNQ